MQRPSRVPLLLALRRRARTTSLCLAILLFIAASLVTGPSHSYLGEYEDANGNYQRLSKYLSVGTPWSRTRPTHTQLQQEGTTSMDSDAKILTALPDFDDEYQTVDDEYRTVDAAVEASSGSGGSEEMLGSPSHTYDRNGLLVVNPDGPHPMYELVRQAEAQWRMKRRKASKTLEEAVLEYKNRYKRAPPKGFDHWWDYVQKYHIQLPDEYDQIYRDLEPYWGIDPRDLQAAQARRERTPESMTLSKETEDGIITLVNMTFSEKRKHMVDEFTSEIAAPHIEMLHEVYQYIPPFRATLNPEDSPYEPSDWTWHNAAIEAAKSGTYLKPEDLPSLERRGWSGTCPHDSPLYLNPPGPNEIPTPLKTKSFIFDHRASMDPCYHPQHVLTHGSFLSHGIGPWPERFMAPFFSNSATPLHADIRVTSMKKSSGFATDDPNWEDKEDDRLFWRGTPTGMWHHSGVNWRWSQRLRLVNLTGPHSAEQMIDADSDFAAVSFLNPDVTPDEPVGDPIRQARRRVNSALMDVSFSGAVQYCEEGEVCSAMESELAWGSSVGMGPGGAGRYKYLIDVDGNGWSQRFRRLLSSNALVFKSTMFPEWWTDRAQAWVHYVPVQVDYSDLYDSVMFFGGDANGRGAHEEMARKIASAGREWVQNFWREEDVVAYMFRLWLEYARVMSSDRDAMSFRLPQEMDD